MKSINLKFSDLNEDMVNSIKFFTSIQINIEYSLSLSKSLNEISKIMNEKMILEKNILEKFSSKDDSGKIITFEGSIKITDPEKFQKEISHLMSSTKTIEFEEIPLSKIGIDKISISIIKPLEFLFV